MFMFPLGLVEFPEVFAVSAVFVQFGFPLSRGSSCMFFPMLVHLDGVVLLVSLQFFVLLFIAFVFGFRSIPMLADVALVQAWVGP